MIYFVLFGALLILAIAMYLIWAVIKLNETGPDGKRHWPSHDDLEGKGWKPGDDET